MTAGGRWRSVLGALLVGAAAVFLGLTIARHWQQIEAYDWEVRWAVLAASIATLALVLGWGVYIWKLVLNRFDHPPIPLRALLHIWFLSNLARYVPGKVWQFVGAAELARKAGLSRAVVLTSMVVHVGFSLLSAAVVSTLILWRHGAPEGISLAAVAVLAAASVFLVHPAILNLGLRLASRVLRSDVLRWRGGWRDGALLLALSVVSWILYGGAFALFLHSVVGVHHTALLPLAGVNALSFLIGYLAVLPPAGLGAREGAMALLLRPFAPAAVAAILAVLSRLWTIAAELLGAATILWLGRRATRRSGRSGGARR
jgi:glycosyltransferase 2 family protein